MMSSTVKSPGGEDGSDSSMYVVGIDMMSSTVKSPDGVDASDSSMYEVGADMMTCIEEM